jgi:hypothetical protein
MQALSSRNLLCRPRSAAPKTCAIMSAVRGRVAANDPVQLSVLGMAQWLMPEGISRQVICVRDTLEHQCSGTKTFLTLPALTWP